MRRRLFGPVLAVLTLASTAVAHRPATWVPSDYPTIQEAVDAASPGDTIVVGPGEYCGVTIDKRVRLLGVGQPTIVGCDDGPALAGVAKVGFLLDGAEGESPADGTSIIGFSIDGEGVSNQNFDPIAFGILARFADDVVVAKNRIFGTAQAITNTAGDRWLVWKNRVTDLTVFDCTYLCAGGDGIVMQLARGSLAVDGGASNPVNRPEQSWVVGNRVAGRVPDGFGAFRMTALLFLSADRSVVMKNRLAIPDNSNAEAPGVGLVVTNQCCGGPEPFLPGSRRTTVAFNDGRESGTAVVVEGTDGANTEGLRLFANRGQVVVEGEVQDQPRSCWRSRDSYWRRD